MDTQYLVVTYSTWAEDDLGPILVATKNYLDFDDATTGKRIPMVGYLLLETLPLDIELNEAQRTADLYSMARAVAA